MTNEKELFVVIENKSTACGTNARHSTYHFKLKNGHNSKTIYFRVMSLDMPLHLVMKTSIPSLVLLPLIIFK